MPTPAVIKSVDTPTIKAVAYVATAQRQEQRAEGKVPTASPAAGAAAYTATAKRQELQAEGVGGNAQPANGTAPNHTSTRTLGNTPSVEGTGARVHTAGIADDLVEFGGGIPIREITQKGATQFRFPAGYVLRFDIGPGQYDSRGPHINLQLPGTQFNQHIYLK